MELMRTNIDIDDQLIEDAMRETGSRTKKGVVEEALRLLVQTRRQGSIRQLRGKVEWNGDLDQSRLDRVHDWDSKDKA
jgi:Arc/MetJ family transcription regulator